MAGLQRRSRAPSGPIQQRPSNSSRLADGARVQPDSDLDLQTQQATNYDDQSNAWHWLHYHRNNSKTANFRDYANLDRDLAPDTIGAGTHRPRAPTNFDHLAQLSCDSGEMILRLNFSEPFKGIVYPDHNRLSPCRFFGDGHHNYELRLPLRGCGTRQVSSGARHVWPDTRADPLLCARHASPTKPDQTSWWLAIGPTAPNWR